MKKSILIPFIVFLIINACQQSDDSIPIIESEEYTVKLNLGGEITFDEVPLNGRISSSGEITYYFVQVNDLQGGVHASGIFNAIPNDLEVILFKDRSYRVDIAAYRKGSGFGLLVSNDSLLNINFSNRTITNRLSYTENLGFAVNSSGNITMYSNADSTNTMRTSGSSSTPNEVDVYFGQTVIDSSFLATEETVPLRMIRNTMGYEINVNNLASGSIQVYVAGLLDLFYANSDSSATRLFVQNTLTNDSSFYTKNYLVSISHRDTVQGIPVNTSLFASNVSFKRLHKKIIEINAPADTTSGNNDNSFGFNISIEDTPLISGDTLTIN